MEIRPTALLSPSASPTTATKGKLVITLVCFILQLGKNK